MHNQKYKIYLKPDPLHKRLTVCKNKNNPDDRAFGEGAGLRLTG